MNDNDRSAGNAFTSPPTVDYLSLLADQNLPENLQGPHLNYSYIFRLCHSGSKYGSTLYAFWFSRQKIGLFVAFHFYLSFFEPRALYGDDSRLTVPKTSKLDATTLEAHEKIFMMRLL